MCQHSFFLLLSYQLSFDNHGLAMSDHFLQGKIVKGFVVPEIIGLLLCYFQDSLIWCYGKNHTALPLSGVVAGQTVVGCGPVSFFTITLLHLGHLTGSGTRAIHSLWQNGHSFVARVIMIVSASQLIINSLILPPFAI